MEIIIGGLKWRTDERAGVVQKMLFSEVFLRELTAFVNKVSIMDVERKEKAREAYIRTIVAEAKSGSLCYYFPTVFYYATACSHFLKTSSQC